MRPSAQGAFAGMMPVQQQRVLETGAVSEEQLKSALASEFGRKGRLLRALLTQDGVDASKLLGAYARRIRVPFIAVDRTQPDPEAIRLAKAEDCLDLGFLPLAIEGGKVVVAMEDPGDHDRVSAVQFRLGKPVMTMLAEPTALERKIREVYGLDEGLAEALEGADEDIEHESVEEQAASIDEIKRGAEDSPTVKLVNAILLKALELGVSDIHIEPQEHEAIVRMRIDGRLRRVLRYPRGRHPMVISRLKIMGDMDISNTRTPQDGRTKVKARGKAFDMRISTLPSIFGEKAVLRILDKSGLSLKLEDLGFHPEALKRVKECITRPTGAVLVTGPTGSGKTTTLYSFLHHIHNEEVNIITVEDPVEFQIRGINQVQINPKAGLTFAAALRSILRQDPDVVMVGEIRDEETAEIAMHAAQTGHLVLSTLHTNDAPSTISRLLEMGIDGPTLAASLSLIVAQRLVRRLCPKCKQPAQLDAEMRERFGIPESVKLYAPKGCKSCLGIGYKGRMGVHEVLYVNDRLRELIAREAPVRDLAQAAREEGMLTLFEDGLDKALQGHTSLEEVLRVSVPPEGFRLADRLGPDGRLLSLKEAELARAREQGSHARREGKPLVLIVDDSSSVRKLAGFVLKSEGIEVREAEDGEQAWAMLQTLKPDLVLCDYEMPKMNGLELIQRARNDRRFDDVAFVMLTSRREEEDEVLGLEGGADDYIVKPIEPMKLIARVKKVIRMYERIRNAQARAG